VVADPEAPAAAAALAVTKTPDDPCNVVTNTKIIRRRFRVPEFVSAVCPTGSVMTDFRRTVLSDGSVLETGVRALENDSDLKNVEGVIRPGGVSCKCASGAVVLEYS
jgi:hypothetical protein